MSKAFKSRGREAVDEGVALPEKLGCEQLHPFRQIVGHARESEVSVLPLANCGTDAPALLTA